MIELTQTLCWLPPLFPSPSPLHPADSSVVVRGGSVRGGTFAALSAAMGGKAVAEGALLEARPDVGQLDDMSTALALEPGSTLVLRRCELCVPPTVLPLLGDGRSHSHSGLYVGTGARGTAVDCACEGSVVVSGGGSSLLYTGLAFAPGLGSPVYAYKGGVARELPAAAGAVGSRPGGSAPPAAPSQAGSHATPASAPVPAGIGGGLGPSRPGRQRQPSRCP
jgi:hypothetical protein